MQSHPVCLISCSKHVWFGGHQGEIRQLYVMLKEDD